jgi:hypothetical protein
MEYSSPGVLLMDKLFGSKFFESTRSKQKHSAKSLTLPEVAGIADK